MNSIILMKCNNLINVIQESIFLYNKGTISDVFKEIISSEPEKINFLINEINTYILPELYYIKETIEENKKIKKSKINYGDYVIKNWPHESSLGLDLIKLLKYL